MRILIEVAEEGEAPIEVAAVTEEEAKEDRTIIEREYHRILILYFVDNYY